MSNRIEILAETPLPTLYGDYLCIAFRHGTSPDTHVALVKGDLAGMEAAPVRVHSECFTGEVLLSLKCDCKAQLEAALQYIASSGAGALIYLRQEGRGIGLVSKLRAYALQAERGLDTVDANRSLGLPDDDRRYDAAARLLEHLGVKSIALLTNNPAKIEGLQAEGIKVVDRIPVLASGLHAPARDYLDTKVTRMGHLIPLDSKKTG